MAPTKVAGKWVYPNMDDLPELNEEAVLTNIETMFNQDQASRPGEKTWSKIYSLVGPVLLALNPFDAAAVPCYNDDWRRAFKKKGETDIDNLFKVLGPHCYGTVEKAYQSLQQDAKQTIIINGDSGSGKTVTNKLMMNYLLEAPSGFDSSAGRKSSGMNAMPSAQAMTTLATMAARSRRSMLMVTSPTDASGRDRLSTAASAIAATASVGLPGRSKSKADIDTTRITMSNELLEAFGNAKTVRNDNSSRFGKFSKIFMDGQPIKASGLEIEHYLLERSRVVQVPKGERNYHILHYLANDLPKGEKYFRVTREGMKVKLADGSEFRPAEEFDKLKDTMEGGGFSEDQMGQIFAYITAVLYLTNVEFDGDLDESRVRPGSREDLAAACEALGLDAERLGTALCQRRRTTPEGTLLEGIGVQEACAFRDAVAKLIYSRIFDWIVRSMNGRLMPGRQVKKSRVIGLLDIFGFEDMPINGFEQMYINLANEAIQSHFNTVMFAKEQEVYKAEGITAHFTPPPSNKACVDMFLEPKGIVRFIGERATTKGGKDGCALVTALNKACKSYKYFKVCDAKPHQTLMKQKRKQWPGMTIDCTYSECFIVTHYAGDVTYVVRDFLLKSRDSVEDHLSDVLQASSIQQIVDLLGKEEDEGSKKQTVGSRFKEQLSSLQREFEISSNQFVRCIKPNTEQRPGLFFKDMVLDQLKCGGVVAALDARRVGLPDRVEYQDFILQFSMLECGLKNEEERQAKKPQARCRALLEDYVVSKFGSNGFAFGSTRLFMKSGVMAHLRRYTRFKKSMSATKIQRCWLLYIGRKVYHDMTLINERLCAVEVEVEQKGFTSLSPVQEALGKAQQAARDGLRKLEEAHEAAEVGDGGRRPTQVITPEEIKKLFKLVERAEVASKEAVERQEVCELRLRSMGQQVTEQVLELKRKVQEAMQVITDSGGEEADTGEEDEPLIKLRATIEKADARVNVMSKELPELVRRAIADLDLSQAVDVERLALPANTQEMSTEVEALRAEIEQAAEELREVRKKIAFETMPEFQELSIKRQAAISLLEEVEVEVGQLRSDGYVGPTEAMHHALDLESKLETIWVQGRDPEAALTLLKRYLEASEAVETALSKAKKEKTEQSERQRDEYKSAITSLPHGKDLQRTANRFFAALNVAEEELRQQHPECSDLPVRSSMTTAMSNLTVQLGRFIQPGRSACASTFSGFDGSPQATARGPIGILMNNLYASREAVEALAVEEVDNDDLAGASLLTEGPWYADEHQILPGKIREEDFKSLTVLDGSKYGSVLEAVQALNRGDLDVDCGFCIGWSRVAGSYFLLFTPDKKEEAHAALSAAGIHFGSAQKGTRFRDVVDKVRAKVDLTKMVETARQHDKTIEEKLREEMQGQVDELLKQVAEMGKVAESYQQSAEEHKQTQRQFRTDLKEVKVELFSKQQEVQAMAGERDNLISSRAKQEQHEKDIKQQTQDAYALVEEQRKVIQKLTQEKMTAAARADFQQSILATQSQIDKAKLSADSKLQHLAPSQEEDGEERAGAESDELGGSAMLSAARLQTEALERELKEKEARAVTAEEALKRAQLEVFEERRKGHEQVLEDEMVASQQLGGLLEEMNTSMQEMAHKYEKDLVDGSARVGEQAEQQQQLRGLLANEQQLRAQLQQSYDQMGTELRSAMAESTRETGANSELSKDLMAAMSQCEKLHRQCSAADEQIAQLRIVGQESEGVLQDSREGLQSDRMLVTMLRSELREADTGLAQSSLQAEELRMARAQCEGLTRELEEARQERQTQTRLQIRCLPRSMPEAPRERHQRPLVKVTSVRATSHLLEEDRSFFGGMGNFFWN